MNPSSVQEAPAPARSEFSRSQKPRLKDEILSGTTTSLAMVPEVVAFAFVAGVSPIIGLYSAFLVGIIAVLLGGRPGMVSGAAGAMAVVVVSLVSTHGIGYLFLTVMLCGFLQFLVGCARLGVLIRMVPYSVVLGFVNGLSIVIFMAQFGSFQTIDDSGKLTTLVGVPLFVMAGLVLLTMLIIWLLPKLTRAIPASLAAIFVVTVLSLGLNSSASPSVAPLNQQHLVLTVGDMLLTKTVAVEAVHAQASGDSLNVPERVQVLRETSSGLSSGIPEPAFMSGRLPPLNWETLWIILPYSLVLAGVGLIESLLTLTLVDEITETRGDGNRECLGQGVANMACGALGGMGGCAMIGQTMINLNSGGRGRLSGGIAALFQLFFILLLAPWIEMIPMAALVGVMFMVVISTFKWASIVMARKVPLTDYGVMVIVAGYTVIMHDLATAVVIGVILSALSFAWKHAQHLSADIQTESDGLKVYRIHGPLYFASVTAFKELFDPQNDPDEVVIDFVNSRVYDQSGTEAIQSLSDKYRQSGKRLGVRHLSSECQKLLSLTASEVVIKQPEESDFHSQFQTEKSFSHR